MRTSPKRILSAVLGVAVLVTAVAYLTRTGRESQPTRVDSPPAEKKETGSEPEETAIARPEPPPPIVAKAEVPAPKMREPEPEKKPEQARVEKRPVPEPEPQKEPEPVASPLYFPGGDSDISSDDSNRARKAIAKWTDPQGKQDDKPLRGEPFYWDTTKVGRPVFLRVLKNRNDKSLLEVWLEDPETTQYELFKTYAVARYSGELGPKTAEGDWQAPEGFYYITPGRLNPHSDYHLSMDIGYPNRYDQDHDRTGSYIMIHGSSVSIGCYAMTDCSIEQIYTLVDRAFANGQRIVRVHCFPFAMTERALEAHEESEHTEFWQNLKEGWDWFETHRRPPNVQVKEERYVFSQD